MRYERKAEEKVNVLRVKEVLKKQKAERFKELMKEEWRVVKIRLVVSEEDDWESFKGDWAENRRSRG